MVRVPDQRAAWLARCVLPHERALRTWLIRRRIAGLDVDDIVQETYARLASLESVDAIRNARTYMFQTAYSIVVSHLRRSRIVSIRAADDIESLGVAASEPTSEDIVQSREELVEIARALASLPDNCRKTFILRRVEGLSQRETASRLGISEKTVEHHMSRSIRFLMDRFGRGGKTSVRASKSGNDIADQSDVRQNEPRD